MKIATRNRIKVAQSARFSAGRKAPFTIMVTAG
jgi:hypothetical protein